MSAAESEPSTSESSRFHRKVIAAILVVVFLLGGLPVAAKALLGWLQPPQEFPLPVLDAPGAIQPGTAAEVRLQAHWGNGTFYSLAWSPDGRYFAIGTTLGLNLYDGRTFQLLRCIELPLRNLSKLAFSPHGDWLAAATVRDLLLLDLSTDTVRQQWHWEGTVAALTYLDDGTLVGVIGSQSDGSAPGILKLEGGRWTVVKSLDADFLVDVAFAPEKQAFLVYYRDSTWWVDPASGKQEKLSYDIPYGVDLVQTHDLLLAVDQDRYLISAYRQGRLLNSTELDGAIDQPLASPDGSLLAAIGPNPTDVQGDAITFWKIPGLERIRSIWVPDISPYVRNEIAFSPSGDRLALLVSPSTVRIFPTSEDNPSEIVITDPFASLADVAVAPGGEMRALGCSGLAVDVLKFPAAISIDRWYFDRLTCGQLLEGGASVAITEPYTPIYLYKVGQAVPPVILKGSSFSSDGGVGAASGGISSSGDPVTLMIWWKAFGWAQRWEFYDDGYEAFNVSVSPSGQYVAATSRSRTYLWVNGIRSGRIYPPLFSRITFSPNERYLASANGILDLKSGRITDLEIEDDLEHYPYHPAPAFSPDGRILVAEVNGTLRFWQVDNGALLAALDDPHLNNERLVFAPDGTFLLGLGDGFVDLWGIPETLH